MSGAEALGKSAADKVVNKLSAPSIIKKNKPYPNSGTKIADSLKKVDTTPVQPSEVETQRQSCLNLCRGQHSINYFI